MRSFFIFLLQNAEGIICSGKMPRLIEGKQMFLQKQ